MTTKKATPQKRGAATPQPSADEARDAEENTVEGGRLSFSFQATGKAGGRGRCSGAPALLASLDRRPAAPARRQGEMRRALYHGS
jgi:hypothetical protein